MTRQDIINRMKESLRIKETMVKAADERLKQWQEELKKSETVLA